MRLQAHKFENRTTFADYAILFIAATIRRRCWNNNCATTRSLYVMSGGQSFSTRPKSRI